MKLNLKKTKVMVFNPCTSIDFMPEISIDGAELEVVEELRLLGVIIRSDMSWASNTELMVQKANKRMWFLRRLKYMGAPEEDLKDVYIKDIRSVLELAVPAWHGAITQAERVDIERIQKSASNIILGDGYVSYKQSLKMLNLESLQARRDRLCLSFAQKSEKDVKFQKWFKPNAFRKETRLKKPKYHDVHAKHSRFSKSPLSSLTKLLNKHYSRK